MPDARSGDCNGRTQGGSNAEVVIAEAFARGLKGIDYNLALKAMLKDAEVPPSDDEKEGRGGLEEYNTLGYIPYGIPRAGTRTVEYSYDDWCIAQIAKGLGKEKLYRKYHERSKNWQHLWRADYEWQGMRGFIMPKDAQGRWLDSVTWGHSKVFRPKIPYAPDRDSPQKPGKTYHANGTFLFISQQALRSLLATGQFVYDKITWRKIAEQNGDIKVAADVDGTMMWIDTQDRLPWVISMKGNPLGIEWSLH